MSGAIVAFPNRVTPLLRLVRDYLAPREISIEDFEALEFEPDPDTGLMIAEGTYRRDSGAADPVLIMWAERNRIEVVATEADLAHDEDRRDELDRQWMAIDERMARTRATTIAGIRAQLELLEWRRRSFVECDEDKILRATIIAGLVRTEREVQP